MRKYRRCKLFLLPALAVWIGICGCGEKAGLVIQDAGSVSELEESKESKESKESETEVTGSGKKGLDTEESGKNRTDQDTSGIYVQVSGAVERPGVYELAAGSRVFQAVEQAGGVTEEAEERYMNQAEVLTDGQMIYVMTREEAQAQKSSGAAAPETGTEAQADGRVNLNTASEEELQTLSGIGAAKARSIVAWREANGGFLAIEDLMQIEGIKEGVFSKIKDSIKVN